MDDSQNSAGKKVSPGFAEWLVWAVFLMACPMAIAVIAQMNWRIHPGPGWHDPTYTLSPIIWVHRLMAFQGVVSLICFAWAFRLTPNYLVRAMVWLAIAVVYVLTMVIEAVAGMAIPGVWL